MIFHFHIIHSSCCLIIYCDVWMSYSEKNRSFRAFKSTKKETTCCMKLGKRIFYIKIVWPAAKGLIIHTVIHLYEPSNYYSNLFGRWKKRNPDLTLKFFFISPLIFNLLIKVKMFSQYSPIQWALGVTEGHIRTISLHISFILKKLELSTLDLQSSLLLW